MTHDPAPFRSDRWITPGVVIVGLLTIGACVLGSVGVFAYLAARGVDTEPVMRLVVTLIGAASGMLSLLLQLANRRTNTKTERNTGLLGATVDTRLAQVEEGQHRMAEALYEVADALPRPVNRHAYPETVARNGATPAPRGS